MQLSFSINQGRRQRRKGAKKASKGRSTTTNDVQTTSCGVQHQNLPPRTCPGVKDVSQATRRTIHQQSVASTKAYVRHLPRTDHAAAAEATTTIAPQAQTHTVPARVSRYLCRAPPRPRPPPPPPLAPPRPSGSTHRARAPRSRCRPFAPGEPRQGPPRSVKSHQNTSSHIKSCQSHNITTHRMYGASLKKYRYSAVSHLGKHRRHHMKYIHVHEMCAYRVCVCVSSSLTRRRP